MSTVKLISAKLRMTEEMRAAIQKLANEQERTWANMVRVLISQALHSPQNGQNRLTR